ncbi:MAG: carbohydrate-binding protein [Verrucomicrobiae bacterium]|nr:carbohydrate-binding protein [Verrucomicrobiae bacterium]
MSTIPVRKHGVLHLLGFLVILILLTMRLPLTSPAQTAATYHTRADQALQSFLLKFWNGGQQYLRDKFPSDGSLTGYWTYANGWDALLDGVERTGGAQYAGLIESFYLGQNARGWTNNYYDDECWMTLALIRAYDLTTNMVYLNQALALYADVQTGWDTTCCGPVPGGLWWDKTRTQKATAANAGAALAGAKLYQRTTNAAYLSFAQQVYSFWWNNMVNHSTFQVCDHINPDGTKVWWKFTYNEGLMIGASVELYEATGDSAYLINAHRLASFMLNQQCVPTAYGSVLYDGSNTGCGGDCHQFKGPAYRYLMRLFRKDPSRTAYYIVLKASADAIWNLARDPANTVFAVNWAGPAQSSGDQGQNNAACAALNLFAQQLGDYPGSGLPENQFEAENATLHRIGLEANYPGYTGWGYLAGWNGNNQWVRFNVNFPTPGGRTLTFRYAAGAGNASRVIAINGVNTFANQPFANTGSWSSYHTVSVSHYFPAGPNTIAVMFNSALGSANFLNLDNLVVTDLRIRDLEVSPSGNVVLTWDSVPGVSYQVQYTTQLPGGAWTNLGSPVPAMAATTSKTDTQSGNETRYYRVQIP